MTEVRSMELSEAIKAGAKRRPQVFGGMVGRPLDATETGTCAVGAACEAVGALVIAPGRVEMHHAAAYRALPMLRQRVETLPCGCESVRNPGTMETAIAHLNDYHHWPRERIAAWVRRMEKK